MVAERGKIAAKGGGVVYNELVVLDRSVGRNNHNRVRFHGAEFFSRRFHRVHGLSAQIQVAPADSRNDDRRMGGNGGISNHMFPV